MSASLVTHRLRSFRMYLSRPQRIIGTVLLRIALGSNVLALYAFHFPQRAFLWGSYGVLPDDVFRNFMHVRHDFSLYAFGDSELFHATIFYIAMGITALFIVGFQTRITSVLFFLCTWSLYARNEILLDGGDNLLILIAFFLMFAHTGGSIRHYSENLRQRPLLSLLHNAAIAAIIIQICIVYFTSAWAKMSGHMWMDGTAIYYILRTTEFNLSPLAPLIYNNLPIVVVLTYGTILLQIAFPFLIWHRHLKYVVIVGAFAFHVAIAYFMGLVWFSATMLSCELVLIDDKTYLRLYHWLRDPGQRSRSAQLLANQS